MSARPGFDKWGEMLDLTIYGGPHFAAVPPGAGHLPWCLGCGWTQRNHPGFILADHLRDFGALDRVVAVGPGSVPLTDAEQADLDYWRADYIAAWGDDS